MLALDGVRRTTVRNVDLGDLVLYWYGQNLVPALRVRATTDTDEAGVILLGLRVGETPTTILFDQVPDNPCLQLGRAITVWSGNSDAVHERGMRPEVGSVILTHTGPAIVAAVEASHFRGVAAWSLGDGTRLAATSDHDRIVAWQMGVKNIDGRFEPIITHPYA